MRNDVHTFEGEVGPESGPQKRNREDEEDSGQTTEHLRA